MGISGKHFWVAPKYIPNNSINILRSQGILMMAGSVLIWKQTGERGKIQNDCRKAPELRAAISTIIIQRFARHQALAALHQIDRDPPADDV